MVILSGANFTIVDDGGIVRCEVVNRTEISAEEGARCAGQMMSFLTARVLHSSSPYSGLVFDVRKGPLAFGPRTRASLATLFTAGELAKKRIGVRCGESATQRMQFSALVAECAPTVGRVFTDDQDTVWARAS